MSSFGSEFRQAQRASQRFEFAAYAACGGAAFCLAAFVGLGVAIWNANYSEDAQQRQMEMAEAARPKSAMRAEAAGNECQSQMRRTALTVNIAMALSSQGRTMLGDKGGMTFDQADEMCRAFEQVGELHGQFAR